jgi:hypothetical protein
MARSQFANLYKLWGELRHTVTNKGNTFRGRNKEGVEVRERC